MDDVSLRGLSTGVVSGSVGESHSCRASTKAKGVGFVWESTLPGSRSNSIKTGNYFKYMEEITASDKDEKIIYPVVWQRERDQSHLPLTSTSKTLSQSTETGD